jgi:hypothetical protein
VNVFVVGWEYAIVRVRDVDCHQKCLTHTLNLQIFLHWRIINEINVWTWEGGVTQGVDM